MQLGVNFIAPQTFPVLEHLIKTGDANFCEIMLDNFIHLEPEAMKKLLGDIPCAFHFVASRFLEKDEHSLTTLASRIRAWSDCLNPLYISDHLVRYKDDAGRTLPLIAEPDYDYEAETLVQRVALWQSLLQRKLWLENHASLTMRGHRQPDFYRELVARTHCGLLFDISNAYIASRNINVPLTAWLPLGSTSMHFHVGGFSRAKDSDLLLDTHDQPLDPVVLQHLQAVCLKNDTRSTTCVIEFDTETPLSMWQLTLNQLSELLGKFAC